MEDFIFPLLSALFFWTLFIIAFSFDRSRYRNCYLLFFALASLIPVIIALAEPYRLEALFTIAGVIMAAIIIVPFFLIYNGVVMYRREGHSIANLLSFVLGVAILIGELATVSLAAVYNGNSFLVDRLPYFTLGGAFVSISVIYVSVSFLVFMIYTVFLQIIPRKRDFDYVIIHGAGLLDGSRISRLLSDRIDKAIDVYRKDPTPPIIIPSGGQGGDEKISEAEAMAGYLREKGIPSSDIVLEARSKTTFENLENSKAIIDELAARSGGRKYTALVTSNYHVYRALRYCRKIGIKCTGIGSRVAFYYWPSALIREFIAIHAETKHAVMFILGWLVFLSPLLMVFVK